ncbi:MAG TPA: cytochrome c biogenesis protein CcsA [Terracidiphilus sp.]|nr:cytochrome c biogenesis protein CcsA [Terracidiphilus sp.]
MYLLWLRVAALLYAAASVTVFPAVLYGVVGWRKTCVHLGGMALFFHFVSVVEMLVQAHHWVPVGFREVQSLLGLAVASVFFLVWWLYDAISLGLFALPATFFMVFVPALGPDRYTFPSQGVRVSWLIAHIAALLLAYVALGFSLLSSILYLAQERRLKAKPRARLLTGMDSGWAPLDWLPPLDTLERMSEAMLEFGFPCMTVGLVIGSVLAQETSLGAAYFLDPKIIAAFVSWAIYVLLLLVRRGAGLRGRKAAYLSGAVFAVMVVVWTANLFSHVHRFGAQ